MDPVRALPPRAALACALLLAACATGASTPAIFDLVSIHLLGETPDLARAEQVLEAVPGVIEVEPVPQEQRLDIAYDPAHANRDQLLAALQDLGFEAELVFLRMTPETVTAPAPAEAEYEDEDEP